MVGEFDEFAEASGPGAPCLSFAKAATFWGSGFRA